MNDKSYFIIAILDAKGTEAIRELQKEIGIELDNLNDILHITLATRMRHGHGNGAEIFRLKR